MCQTDYSIHSKLRILPYTEGKYNIQANEKFTKVKEIWCFCFFIFFVSMSQTTCVINRSGARYFLHVSNQWHVCRCLRVRSHAPYGEACNNDYHERYIFSYFYRPFWVLPSWTGQIAIPPSTPRKRRRRLWKPISKCIVFKL